MVDGSNHTDKRRVKLMSPSVLFPSLTTAGTSLRKDSATVPLPIARA